MDNQDTKQPDNKTSNKTVVIGFVILVVVISGILVYMLKSSSSTKSAEMGTSQVGSVDPAIQDKNEAQLDIDAQKINTDITSLGEDVSNIDKSLVDQPVDLSQ